MITPLFQTGYGRGAGRQLPTLFASGIRAALLAIAVATSAPAWAQAHVSTEGPFTLRASTVSSETLPESTAKAHGIDQDPQRGVLNVAILRKTGSAEDTLHAEVHAIARNLSGQKLNVAMREVEANGYVSYMGTYDFVRGEVIDFLIEAKPQGSEQKLDLTFRDRMWLAR